LGYHIRYDIYMRPCCFAKQKLMNSQLNLPHGTEQKKTNEETKNKKKRDAEKKRSSHKVHVVSPDARRESMVRKVCDERGRF